MLKASKNKYLLKRKKIKLTLKINKLTDKFNLEENENKREDLMEELGDLINKRRKLDQINN